MKTDYERFITAITIILSLFVSVLIIILICITSSPTGYNELPERKPLDAGEWTFIGEFEMKGQNATPLKEITTDQYQYLEVRVDKYSTEVPVNFLLEVYYYGSKEIPESTMRTVALSGEDVIVKCPAKKGYIVQILTQVYNEEGIYDNTIPCKVSLSYRLTN